MRLAHSTCASRILNALRLFGMRPSLTFLMRLAHYKVRFAHPTDEGRESSEEEAIFYIARMSFSEGFRSDNEELVLEPPDNAPRKRRL